MAHCREARRAGARSLIDLPPPASGEACAHGARRRAVEAQAEAGRAAAACERASNPAPSEDSAGVAGSERAAGAREQPPPGDAPGAAPVGGNAAAGAAPERLGGQAAAAGLHEPGSSAAGAGGPHAWPEEAAPDLASDSEGDDDSDDLEGYQDVLVRPQASTRWRPTGVNNCSLRTVAM